MKENKKKMKKRKNTWKGLEVQLRKGTRGKEIMEFLLSRKKTNIRWMFQKKRGIRLCKYNVCISVPKPKIDMYLCKNGINK